ncbi:MAG: hypothetical protein EOP83_04680 [Verrucomicrobiaceae bacterium]|nr:MAG: hypothetical protein EOP83_04680 [Verrucomicrobiaceae bacterium]
MPKYIVHQDGWFFEWSTVVDAPTTFGMKLDEFKEYYRDHYGSEGMRELGERLDRAITKGTSSFMDTSGQSLMDGFNRAGYRETYLSIPEIVRIYCVERREPVEGEGEVIQHED